MVLVIYNVMLENVMSELGVCMLVMDNFICNVGDVFF